MNRTILMIAAVLVAAPLALAHKPVGTPKSYCEDPASEWWIHDYGPASANQFSFTYYDGNVGDCDGDTVPYDADGHYEYAAGGAWFPVQSFDAGFYGNGSGSVPCFGVEGHHPAYGTFVVADGVASPVFATQFTVAVDMYDATGLNPGCGDGFMDYSQTCFGPCSVWFPPGLDGSYYVFIQGTVGHAWLS